MSPFSSRSTELCHSHQMTEPSLRMLRFVLVVELRSPINMP